MFRMCKNDWLMLGCAGVGRGHIRQNICCQDRFFFQYRHGVNAIALADGAGSARYSHVGAEVVAREICQLACERFMEWHDSPSVEAVQGAWCEALRQELGKTGLPYRELASTMLVAAVCGDKYIVGHIGDGVIGYLRQGVVQAATVPQNGEFANSTVFVTSPEAKQSLRLVKGRLAGIEGFVLMSDGAAASLYAKQSGAFAKAAGSIFSVAPLIGKKHLQKILEQELLPRLRAKTLDDCSVAFMLPNARISHAVSKRLTRLLAAMEKGLPLPAALKKAGIRKKYHARYMARLRQHGWVK